MLLLALNEAIGGVHRKAQASSPPWGLSFYSPFVDGFFWKSTWHMDNVTGTTSQVD